MDAKQIETLDPSIIVIFGITGDLASRKLLPALYNLARNDLLPHHLKIVGITRKGTTTEALLANIQKSLEAAGEPCDHDALQKLGTLIEIVTMDLLDAAAYTALRARLAAIEDEAGMCMTQLFYLAIPAQSFSPLVKQLASAGLNTACQHGSPTRLLIEKPFGYDLASAQELITDLNVYFSEDQTYRIDHYLAKETAQNILIFRFQNPIFKQIWNNKGISHVMITAAEEIGIEGRTAFYEQTGALRDLVQSHLLQLLALATMDEPSELTSAAIHRQKLALLQNIVPISLDKVAELAVRGQYEGYRKEVDHAESVVETYAALQLAIDTERWRGVPILLRTGKAMPEKVIDITIVFAASGTSDAQNVLTIRIQPNEGISLRLLAKKPGLTNKTEPVQMDFCYGQSFGGGAAQADDPYARVLMDAFRGDKTLFATNEEVLACWRIVEPILHEWAKNDTDLHRYTEGSWGPQAADTLAKNAGIEWLTQDLKVCTVHTSHA